MNSAYNYHIRYSATLFLWVQVSWLQKSLLWQQCRGGILQALFCCFFFCWGGTQNLLAIYSHGLTGLKTEVRVLKQWNSRLPKLFPKLSQRPLLNYRKYLGKKIKIQPMMSQKMMLKTYSNTNFWMHLNVMRPSISWNKSRLNVVKSLL